MNYLEKRILKDGIALNSDVLKVDSFLNHQVDPKLMEWIGDQFYQYFAEYEIDKVVTIESSGISPALFTAYFLNVPLLVLKKQNSVLQSNVYSTTVHSFTKGNDYNLTCSKDYIKEGENILIIDDFLANGEASLGACRIVEMANANVCGVGICIEKSYQPGREKLNNLELRVYSLARIESLEKGKIKILEK